MIREISKEEMDGPLMEGYRELDARAPDGLAKDIVAHLVWNELLENALTDDVPDGERMVAAERAIRELFFEPKAKKTGD